MILTLIIVSLAVAALVVSWIARRTPLHPLFWLPPFAFAYTCAYTISRKIDIGVYGPYELKLLVMGFVAFASALIAAAVMAKIIPYKQLTPVEVQNRLCRPFRLELIIFYSLCAVTGCILVWLLSSGYASKRELNDYFLSEYRFVVSIWVVFIVFSVRQIWICFSQNKLLNQHVIIAGIWSILYWLIMGQREAIFGLGLVWLLLFMYQVNTKYRVPLLFGAILAFSAIEPVTASFKSVLIGEQRITELRAEDLLYPAPYSGATRNCEILIENNIEIPTQDLLRRELLRPFSIMGVGQQTLSMSAWYNLVLREQLGIGGSSGWGFTMVGSGLLLGGFVGIAGMFLVYGGVLGGLFKFANSSFFWATIYLYVIPLSVYVLRQDFAYFLSAVGKQAIIPLAIFTVIDWIVRR